MGLFRELKADEIECRVSTMNKNGLSLLLYKDARVDQNILDETFGVFGWQRRHELIGGNLYCTVSVKNPETGEWISKQDVGTESYTEKEKGQASDSFKRACFNLGIGRELYTAPFIWVQAGNYNVRENNGRETTYDRFNVADVEIKDGRITYLVILNESRKNQKVFEFGTRTAASGASTDQAVNSTSKEQKPEGKLSDASQRVDMNKPISPKQVLTLQMLCKRHEMPENMIYQRYRHGSLQELTLADWADFGKTGNLMLEKWDKERK